MCDLYTLAYLLSRITPVLPNTAKDWNLTDEEECKKISGYMRTSCQAWHAARAMLARQLA